MGSLPLAVLLAVLLAACGGDRATVTVLAAASLADAFADVEAAFEADHPDVDVVVDVGASSSLREQILAGAPADVFAPAGEADLAAIDAAGGRPFATNELVLAVPAGNPGDVRSLADLERGGLLVGLCAAEVPCGRYTLEALAAAGVSPAPDTLEPDVRSLLTKLEAGELDVGIVYRTDALAAGDDVEVVTADLGVVASYPIAARTDDGEAFVDFVLGDEGRAILADHGFGPPG